MKNMEKPLIFFAGALSMFLWGWLSAVEVPSGTVDTDGYKLQSTWYCIRR